MRSIAHLACILTLVSACTPAAMDEGEDSAELADPTAPVYPPDQAHSPLTDEVVAHLRAVLAAGGHDPTLFSKLGDSITFSTSFAACFARTPVRSDAELEATRQHFIATPIGSTTSFDRVSLSATIGWMAVKAIQGAPNSALDRELDATDAAFAVVMYGTNDTYAGGQDQFRRNLTKIVDRLLARGVVPILSTIPPRRDAAPNALVPSMNQIIRTIAEQKRVPLMDLWLRMSTIPGYGLSSDGIHPNVASGGCDFSSDGLKHGYNVRNLLLIEALDRMRRLVEN